jgi:hypothetical protein
MPSRLGAYRALLQDIVQNGYEICPVAHFWGLIQKNQLCQQKYYMVLRHDIDTDPRTAQAMWQIDRSLGVQSTYYFRLSTVDFPLMQEIDRTGGEASYHFEEIATVAKQKRLKTREQVLRHMPHIRELFRYNLSSLRQHTGIPMRTVASHGDFANRRLGLANQEILKDESFRKEVDIELEVNDQQYMSKSTVRHFDTSYPDFWKNKSPLNSVKERKFVIYVLIHPRHWFSNIKINLIDNFKRAYQGISYYC